MKFKQGEEIEFIYGKGVIEKYLGIDKHNQDCYLIRKKDEDGYDWWIESENGLKKLLKNKFKQGDILQYSNNQKHLVLKYYESQLSNEIYYVILKFEGGQHHIAHYDKEVVENNFTKVGEI